ncbi:EKC KEOPS complex subunit LAGE3 [Brachionus plicatilis]|uniref:L antigen family member 3 n=1 Tax=Brachionus plicatilis TaxID=10195 RepID=A0A3M7QV16_BRAPC|nr:EKC KEOPS complex subunit LAGE3 [Brachionus plicatilis]
MNDLLTAQLTIPFSCQKHAKIVYETLRVDQEPRKNLIKREISLNPSSVTVAWWAKESRILRVSVQSIIDHIHSILTTIHQFE